MYASLPSNKDIYFIFVHAMLIESVMQTNIHIWNENLIWFLLESWRVRERERERNGLLQDQSHTHQIRFSFAVTTQHKHADWYHNNNNNTWSNDQTNQWLHICNKDLTWVWFVWLSGHVFRTELVTYVSWWLFIKIVCLA